MLIVYYAINVVGYSVVRPVYGSGAAAAAADQQAPGGGGGAATRGYCDK